MDALEIEKWMVWQSKLGERGMVDTYMMECCQGWVPALYVTHIELMKDIVAWMEG